MPSFADALRARGCLPAPSSLASLFAAVALAACGGGGGSSPVEGAPTPPPPPGPELTWVAPGTEVLATIEIPSRTAAFAHGLTQAFLANDGRIALRITAVHGKNDGVTLNEQFERIYTRAANGTWAAAEPLTTLTSPGTSIGTERWNGNDAGWLWVTDSRENIFVADSAPRAIGSGVGQALRSAPRHAPAADERRLGHILGNDGTLHLLDARSQTAADPEWRVSSTRVPADGSAATSVVVLKHTAANSTSAGGVFWQNSPQLSFNPTATLAALYWAEPFIPNQEPMLEVVRLRDGETLIGSPFPLAGVMNTRCNEKVHTATWGTVVTSEVRGTDNVCRLVVRVAETRVPLTTTTTDTALSLPGHGLVRKHWTSTGPDGQLMVLWLQSAGADQGDVLAMSTAQVPAGNLADRAWTWTPPAAVTFEGKTLSDAVVKQGTGGHVALVFTSQNQGEITTWLRRYSPGKGWEPDRKVFTRRYGSVAEDNVSVAADGKVLIAYAISNDCLPTAPCTYTLYPRAVVFD